MPGTTRQSVDADKSWIFPPSWNILQYLLESSGAPLLGIARGIKRFEAEICVNLVLHNPSELKNSWPGPGTSKDFSLHISEKGDIHISLIAPWFDFWYWRAKMTCLLPRRLYWNKLLSNWWGLSFFFSTKLPIIQQSDNERVLILKSSCFLNLGKQVESLFRIRPLALIKLPLFKLSYSSTLMASYSNLPLRNL